MTTAFDPATAEEYHARSTANSGISGFGFESVRISSPCPFCAAPGWAEYRLVEVEEQFGQERTCGVCERSGVFEQTTLTAPDGSRSTTTISFRQTGGDEPPEYLRETLGRTSGFVQTFTPRGASDD